MITIPYLKAIGEKLRLLGVLICKKSKRKISDVAEQIRIGSSEDKAIKSFDDALSNIMRDEQTIKEKIKPTIIARTAHLG